MPKKRIQTSLGVSYINDGEPTIIKEEPYEIDYSRRFIVLDVIPMGAPRMTQSDRWKTNPNHKDPRKRQRDVVTRYFNLKNTLVEICDKYKFSMSNSLDIVFLIPMPKSWSKKKKEKMNKMPHKSKPDLDNLIKGVKDALKKDDSDVWIYNNPQKRWAYKGSIIIYY